MRIIISAKSKVNVTVTPDLPVYYEEKIFKGEKGDTGAIGPTGPQGTNGVGVPVGGTSGQILTKVDATDFNTTWQDNYADWTSVVKHIVKNNGSGLITKGTAVYSTGSNGTNILVGKASNATEATSSKTIGLTQSDLTTTGTNSTGFVVTEGLLGGLNTAGTTAGDPVWLGVNGALIYGLTNKPYAPAHLVFIGIVTKVSAGNGEVFVKVQNGFELKEIHDVDVITTTPINGHLLGFDGTFWVNKTIASWLGFTPVTNARTIATTSPLQGGGDLSANRTLSILQASISQDGFLGQTDWNTFNSKFNLPALNSGSVLFSNGTTIAQDNSNFFWDDTTKRLRIGTNTPANANGRAYLVADVNNYPLILTDKTQTYGLTYQVNGTTFNIFSDYYTGSTTPSLGFGTFSNKNMLFLNSIGNILINSTTDQGGKLQIKAGGAASTDIALRIRNSGDTFNLANFDGSGRVVLNANYTAGGGFGTLIINTTDTATDNIGPVLTFSGNYTGTTPVNFAMIRGAKSPIGGQRGYLSFHTDGSGASLSVERMRVDWNGNVGIGITTPQQALDVFSTTNYQNILVRGNAAPSIGFVQTTGTTPTWKIGISGNFGNNLAISSGAANTDLMTFGATGVGIGITNATSPLHIANTIALSAGATNPSIFNLAYTINNSGAQTGTATGILLNATETALNGQVHNLLNLQVAGVSKFRVNNQGGIICAATSTIPVAIMSFINDSTNAISIFSFAATTGNTNFAGGRFQFGGTTNLFPAIKRNGAAIDFRLADDSGFCNINAQSIIAAGDVAVGTGQAYNFGTNANQINHYSGISFGFKLSNAWVARITTSGTVFGSDTINSSAILQAVSTTKGFLPPTMTTAQKNAITSPATGLVVFDTDLAKLCVFATTWQTITSI